jgi:hypothetical protein
MGHLWLSLYPGFAKLVEPWRELGHLWLWGGHLLPGVADDLLIAQVMMAARFSLK